MFVNENLLKQAKEVIDRGESSFTINRTLVFFVSEKKDYNYETGSMPIYFDYNGKRYVVYKKPNQKA